MTNETNDLPQNEQTQTEETLNEREGKSLLFYLVLVLLLLVILATAAATYFFYPFTMKIDGVWESSDQRMQLSSQAGKWELELPNYQQTKGLTLVYHGEWHAAGVNKYDGQEVELSTKITKASFSKEELAALTQKSELYTIASQTNKTITLKYTKKGLEKIQATADLNKIVHLTLEELHWDKKRERLYLNSSYFADERIEFQLKREK
ncbi:hypothetical protein GIX45_25410 [Erwinia sp. CPCC 100877]|nr:hypothetical protein [Erwinia sp. CPCC 100877]